jgi:hypothetical protein
MSAFLVLAQFVMDRRPVAIIAGNIRHLDMIRFMILV